MKVGDIVYFKSIYTARYTKQGGSYEYHFKPGDRYLITDVNNVYGVGFRTGNITNLEDGTTHFAHSSHWDKIISVDEWRDLQLSKIL